MVSGLLTESLYKEGELYMVSDFIILHAWNNSFILHANIILSEVFGVGHDQIEYSFVISWLGTTDHGI